MKQPQASLLLIAVMFLTVILSLKQIYPPAPLPESAPADLVSAQRALHHVREIAARPHPVGSAENAQVRDYLLTQLRALGLDPTIQKSTAVATFDYTRAAVVQNIIATLKGTESSKPVLLAAHYDSSPDAPGAADDGYAVAAILETIRALKSHPPLKNDLIILMTDGEEPGLLGAKAFVEESPLADGIGIVLNFEGRGSSGPSIMFETTDDYGWVISEFNTALSSRIGYSLSYDIYKFLPNNTDFTFLKQRASGGLNFAHIRSVRNYHSVRDDIDQLNPRTVQHHGNAMLQSVLHFGNLSLTQTRAPNATYFPFLVPRFVFYPNSWNTPLAVLASLSYLVLVVWGFRQKHLQFWKMFLSSLILLLRVALAAGGVFLLWKRLAPLQPEFGLLYWDTIYHGELYLLGFLALGIAIAFLFHRYLSARLGPFNLALTSLFWWIVLCWVTVTKLPGGTYLFLWPLLFSLGAISILMKRNDLERPSVWTLVVLTVCAVPGVYLFSQLVVLLFDSMTLMIAASIVGLAVFLFGTLQLQLSVISQWKQWTVPLLSFLAALAYIGGALLTRGPSDEMPKPNSLFYAVDADSAHAWWGTWESDPDDWTKQFISAEPQPTWFRGFFPSLNEPLLVATAPTIEMPAPVATLLQESRKDSLRTLLLRVSSPRAARSLALYSYPAASVLDVCVNGKPARDSLLTVPMRGVRAREWWTLSYQASPTDTLLLEVTVPINHPFSIRVVDRSQGLPAPLLQGYSPRSASMMPRPFVLTDVTIVGKTFTF